MVGLARPVIMYCTSGDKSCKHGRLTNQHMLGMDHSFDANPYLSEC